MMSKLYRMIAFVLCACMLFSFVACGEEAPAKDDDITPPANDTPTADKPEEPSAEEPAPNTPKDKSDEPSEPAEPSEPDDPDVPTEPDVPSEPTEPEHPTQPEVPSEPQTPAKAPNLPSVDEYYNLDYNKTVFLDDSLCRWIGEDGKLYQYSFAKQAIEQIIFDNIENVSDPKNFNISHFNSLNFVDEYGNTYVNCFIDENIYGRSDMILRLFSSDEIINHSVQSFTGSRFLLVVKADGSLWYVEYIPRQLSFVNFISWQKIGDGFKNIFATCNDNSAILQDINDKLVYVTLAKDDSGKITCQMTDLGINCYKSYRSLPYVGNTRCFYSDKNGTLRFSVTSDLTITDPVDILDNATSVTINGKPQVVYKTPDEYTYYYYIYATDSNYALWKFTINGDTLAFSKEKIADNCLKVFDQKYGWSKGPLGAVYIDTDFVLWYTDPDGNKTRITENIVYAELNDTRINCLKSDGTIWVYPFEDCKLDSPTIINTNVKMP